MRTSILSFLAALFVIALGVGGFIAFRGKSAPPPPPPPPVPLEYPIVKNIGKSAEGRTIAAYLYGTGPKHVVFVGGIHGGYEWNSVMLAQRYMAHLDTHQSEIPASVTVVIIPDLNPDAVFKALGATENLAQAEIPKDDLSEMRFNANKVDLNRNFDCKWAPTGTWRDKTVSAGSAAFSEPESKALRDFVLAEKPVGMVFWHSQAGAVYASQCENGILPQTLAMMSAYAAASGYDAVKEFDAYEVHGAAEDWLASLGVPTLSVELKTHESIEWEENLAGTQALLSLLSR